MSSPRDERERFELPEPLPVAEAVWVDFFDLALRFFLPAVALVSPEAVVPAVAVEAPEVAPDDIEPLVAELLLLGVVVCARTGSAAATRAAKATLPRSFFMEFPFLLA
jgi:hypothetical protein